MLLIEQLPLSSFLLRSSSPISTSTSHTPPWYSVLTGKLRPWLLTQGTSSGDSSCAMSAHSRSDRPAPRVALITARRRSGRPISWKKKTMCVAKSLSHCLGAGPTFLAEALLREQRSICLAWHSDFGILTRLLQGASIPFQHERAGHTGWEPFLDCYRRNSGTCQDCAQIASIVLIQHLY